MPSSLRSFTSSAMRSIRRALFTWYGISVTMIAVRPLLSSVSIGGAGAQLRMPRPVA